LTTDHDRIAARKDLDLDTLPETDPPEMLGPLTGVI
jgi:hypothetical protein